MSAPRKKAARGGTAPAERRGAPRPLAAHVAAAASDLQHGVALAVAAADERFPWRPSLRPLAEEIAQGFAAHDPSAVRAAVAETALSDALSALDGMAAYQAAPPLRRPAEPPAVWRAGAARLLDYGGETEDAPALLVLPSLVNGPWILDISRARSFLRGLRRRGLRPLLLDWGDPSREERNFDLGAYVERRAAPALERAAALTGQPRIGLLGHCMSGALAAATAARRPERVERFALMAAPWRFAPLRPPEGAQPRRRELQQLIEACGAVFGGVPSDILNTLFFLRDPLQATRKFPQFAKKGRNSDVGRRFVAIEDWLGHGPRLAAPAAKTLFLDWGLDDALYHGRWIAEGALFQPRAAAAPALVIASASDTVAPYDSVAAAADALPNARLLKPGGGHVGMLVGRGAEAALWDPVAAFFRD
ncbi:MAG: alpha/beta fold hydrolase [Pseudomonadota bacterium]